MKFADDRGLYLLHPNKSHKGTFTRGRPRKHFETQKCYMIRVPSSIAEQLDARIAKKGISQVQYFIDLILKDIERGNK